MISNVGDARLSIEVTRRCNSSCIHCFAGGGQNKQTEMEFNVLTRIVQEGAAAGYCHLHITGGEPMLYRHLFEALDHAVEAGYKTILLNTNGILLTEQSCEQFAKYPGLTITISLEGSKALHDRLRGKGSYRKVLKGLEIGLAGGLDIIIFSLACKSLLQDLPQFTERLFSDYSGIQYLALSRLLESASGHHLVKNEFLSPKDFLNIVKTVSLLNLYGWPTAFIDEPLANVIGDMLNLSGIPRSRALHCRGNLMVLADLTLSLSHTSKTFHRKYSAGSMKALLSSKDYEQVVCANQNTCGTCRHAAFCCDNGLLRPVKTVSNSMTDSLFCQEVLNLAQAH
jgi:MoaA/NifB/PqqE/SkfB family radical SAM enzyme